MIWIVIRSGCMELCRVMVLVLLLVPAYIPYLTHGPREPFDIISGMCPP